MQVEIRAATVVAVERLREKVAKRINDKVGRCRIMVCSGILETLATLPPGRQGGVAPLIYWAA